jgi:urease accessory protein
MNVMLKVFEILPQPRETAKVLTLPFELRQKSRLKAELNDGTEVGLMLPRGHLLRGGDCLLAEDGSVIRIEAADEVVSTVNNEDPLMIARASYHLGNRHVALQIGDGWLRYQHDHVLDDMVRGLGLEVICESAPFEPEGGAYGGHAHGHDHHHAHEHHHDHDHVH